MSRRDRTLPGSGRIPAPTKTAVVPPPRQPLITPESPASAAPGSHKSGSGPLTELPEGTTAVRVRYPPGAKGMDAPLHRGRRKWAGRCERLHEGMGHANRPPCASRFSTVVPGANAAGCGSARRGRSQHLQVALSAENFRAPRSRNHRAPQRSQKSNPAGLLLDLRFH